MLVAQNIYSRAVDVIEVIIYDRVAKHCSSHPIEGFTPLAATYYWHVFISSSCCVVKLELVKIW